MQIAALKVDFTLDERIYSALLRNVSAEKQERLRKFVRYEDKLRGLFAELLLRKMVEELYHLSHEKIKYDVNRYGKPYIPDVDNIHFNISHSGYWVACAIDEHEVGIDVEIIKESHPDIAERFFTKRECEQIFSFPKEDQSKVFYTFWTLKESYIKCRGKGLSIRLDSFSFELGDTIRIFEQNKELSAYRFTLTHPDDSHILACCGNEKPKADDVIYYDMNKLLEYFT